jgi:hypothetical protein
MVEALLHRLFFFTLFAAVALAGCGEGYTPPESKYSPSRTTEDQGSGNDIDFKGRWKITTLSQDGVPLDLEASGLDVVLDIAANGTARWYVKEDGEHYYYCSADDMVLEQDPLNKDRVSISYYHVLVDPQTLQVVENEGRKQTHFTAVQPDDNLVRLLDGHPPRGIVMLPALNLFGEQDIVSLTLEAVSVDLSGSASTQYGAQHCSIKTDVIDSGDPPADEEPPLITRFTLTSGTPTMDPAIAFDLEGRDNVAVSAWLVNESDAVPAVDDAAWSDSRPTAYTLSSGYGMKTVYAWAKDAGGNISDPASISIDYVSDPPCQYIEVPASLTQFYTFNVFRYNGGLSSLLADDDDFLEMEINSTQTSMMLTVDFQLVDTDVRDLRVRVSSLSSRYFQDQPSAFVRTVSAYNHAAQEWTVVDPARSIGDTAAVLTDIALAGNVENIVDYLGQEGDRLNVRLMIEMDRVTDGSWQHDMGLVELLATQPVDPNCVDY